MIYTETVIINGKQYVHTYSDAYTLLRDGVIYLCIRDTENPVYNALADLVGIYVEIV